MNTKIVITISDIPLSVSKLSDIAIAMFRVVTSIRFAVGPVCWSRVFFRRWYSTCMHKAKWRWCLFCLDPVQLARCSVPAVTWEADGMFSAGFEGSCAVALRCTSLAMQRCYALHKLLPAQLEGLYGKVDVEAVGLLCHDLQVSFFPFDWWMQSIEC